MGTLIKLSNSAIQNIFALRAQGKSFLEISERYPCSDNYIRLIIKRVKYSKAIVNGKTVDKAQSMKTSTYRKRKKVVPKPAVAVGVDFTPLARLMTAQSAVVAAYKECVRSKIGRAFIDLALEEAGEIKR